MIMDIELHLLHHVKGASSWIYKDLFIKIKSMLKYFIVSPFLKEHILCGLKGNRKNICITLIKDGSVLLGIGQDDIGSLD